MQSFSLKLIFLHFDIGAFTLLKYLGVSYQCQRGAWEGASVTPPESVAVEIRADTR